MARNVSVLALLAVMLGAVGREIHLHPWCGPLAVGGLLLYVLLQGAAVRGTGRWVLGLAGSAALLALFLAADPAGLLYRAGLEAAALIGLFTALGFLREAAESSAMIQRSGDVMVRQPPGRRYLVLALGAHVISLVLNFGVLPLLGTMVMKGNSLEAAGGKADIVAIRTRRMLSAVLRGFTAMTAWSPLSVSFVVTQTVVRGVDWRELLPLQMVLTAFFLWLGWYLDRRSFPPSHYPPVSPSERPDLSWRPVLGLCLLVAGIVGASVLMAEMLGVRLVVGAMLVIPPTACIWLWVQQGSAWVAAKLLAGRLGLSFPAFRNEVAMIGGAMFFGQILVALLPGKWIADGLAWLALPPALVIILLAGLVMGLARYGLSQIVSVTVLGGALTNLSSLHLPPLVLASALMGAWALSTSSTPVGAAVLSIARLANVPLKEVANRWNGHYVGWGMVILVVWVWGLMLWQ